MLSEYRNDRLICKHFNLSWVELRDNVDVVEYICLLAEALDAEELAAHEFATLTAIGFHNPKYLKKWKWASRDKAGTRAKGKSDWASGFTAMAMELSGGMQGMSAVTAPEQNADQRKKIIEMARARGRRVIYMDSQGNYFDEHGLPTNRDNLCSIIQVTDKGEIFH